MITNLALVFAIPAFVILIVWLASRHRNSQRQWGDPQGQASVLTGAETDAPRSIPTEPLKEPSVNGAEVDDLSHEFRAQ